MILISFLGLAGERAFPGKEKALNEPCPCPCPARAPKWLVLNKNLIENKRNLGLASPNTEMVVDSY